MHFLEWIPPRQVVWLILVFAFAAMLAIWLQFLPLEDTMMARGGYGIVDYELAFTPEKASEILNSWGDEARSAAKRSLIIDYGFMPAYGLFFGMVTLLLARAQADQMRTIGFALTIGSLVAALLDALENTMLLIILSGSPVTTLPPLIAGVAASLKFLLLILALLYWPISLLRLVMRRA